MAWLAGVVRSGLLVAVALRTARRRAAAVAELERANRDLDGRVRERTAELARNEARLGLALDAAAMAEWECDLATWTFAPSPRLNALFGYPPDRRLTIEDLRARYHPDDAERNRRLTAEALAAGQRLIEHDYRIVLPDGSVRWLYTRGEAFRGADGRPVRAAGVVMDITERRRAEQALRESEERFRVALKHAPVMVFRYDRDLRYTWAYNTHPDFPPEALIGKTDAEIVPGELGRELVELKRGVLEGGVGARREIAIALRGRLHTFDLVAEPLRDGDGGIVGVTAAAVDITERKRAEEVLRRSEARYRALAEATSQAIWVWDPTAGGGVDETPPWWEEVTGQTPEQQAELGWLAALHPGDRERARAAWLGALATGTPYSIEYRVRRRRDGDYVHVATRVVPVHGPDGAVREWVGSVADVTSQRLAEAALRRERELLQRIMDTIPVMIVLYEPDTRVLRLNPEFERLIGWSTEEVRTVDLMAACYPDPDYRETVRAFMASAQEGWRDIEMTTRDGRVVQTSWANIRFPDNTRVGIGIDITERKRAEQHQRLLLAELSHRVKNTLATVQSIAVRSLTAGGRPVGEALDAFMDRLRSLGNTHSLLTAGEWQGASLRRLVEAELAPYGRRAVIASEDLTLNPKAALTLGLVLHELATNAAKYGALSAPTGRVEIAWTVENGVSGGPSLRLVWRERDGPPVVTPERLGFGRTLIERAVAYDLNGTARLDFHPDGVICELAAPLDEVAAA